MNFYFEQRFKVFQKISTDVCNNIKMLKNYHSCFLNNLSQSCLPKWKSYSGINNLFSTKYEDSEHKFKSIWLHMFKQTSWFQRCQVYCNLDEAWCGILAVLWWQHALAGLTPPLSSATFGTRILKNQTQNLFLKLSKLRGSSSKGI